MIRRPRANENWLTARDSMVKRHSRQCSTPEMAAGLSRMSIYIPQTPGSPGTVRDS